VRAARGMAGSVYFYHLLFVVAGISLVLMQFLPRPEKRAGYLRQRPVIVIDSPHDPLRYVSNHASWGVSLRPSNDSALDKQEAVEVSLFTTESKNKTVENVTQAMKWAIATLVTMSSGKTREANTITYTDQAVLLAKQLSGRYPAIPLLAVIQRSHLGLDDQKLLEKSGYRLLDRESLVPPCLDSSSSIASVYADQYMKFWLWNETSFDYIVYLDSDTYFTNASLLDFQAFFSMVKEDAVVACPTRWSQVAGPEKKPITWNGGFFIIRPSDEMFKLLMYSEQRPTHFISHYGENFAWFDVSEMGMFMRDLPVFSIPSPLWQYCADTQMCCVTDKCETKFDMQKQKGAMVHGMKPDGLIKAGEALTYIFDKQRLNVFQEWGFDPDCMLSNFYNGLMEMYVQSGLILLS
jgi:hypothetical protein